MLQPNGSPCSRLFSRHVTWNSPVFLTIENIGHSGLMACRVFSNLKDLQCEIIITTKGNKNKHNLLTQFIIIINTKSPLKSVQHSCVKVEAYLLCNEFPLALARTGRYCCRASQPFLESFPNGQESIGVFLRVGPSAPQQIAFQSLSLEQRRGLI